MKYLKSFTNLIKEGASLEPPDYETVDLEWMDDKSEPLEVLKTNNSNDVAGFRDKIGLTKDGSFQIYYGLTVDPKRNASLGNSDPVFKITLDELKAANLEDPDDLSDFISNTANRIANVKGKVDYIVPMGSTKGLSTRLAEVFSEKFSNAEVIPLKKYTFSNIASAMDWDYINSYEARARGEGVGDDEEVPRSVLVQIKNQIIDEIDRIKTPATLIAAIRGAQTPEELRGIILRSDPNNRYHKFGDPQIEWINPNYEIRSSGLQFGGSRKLFKTKYETPKASGEFGSPEFTEAVISCIRTRKTMLFLDDNARTKEDLSKIFDSIMEVAERVLPSEQLTKDESLYFKRFFAYVLIYIPVSGGEKSKSEITVKKLAGEDEVTRFRSDLRNFDEWIKKKG
jgi:hypothetical protein